MRLSFPSVVAAMLLTTGAAIADPYQDGQVAFQQQDYAAALQAWLPLADRGVARAQFGVGVIYDRGLGVAQNYSEAVKWYRRAADQGDGLAQINLGSMASQGRGAEPDNVCALMWFNLAAAQDVEYAAVDRDSLARAMPSYEVRRAQALSREWRPEPAAAQPANGAPVNACPRTTPSSNGFVALN